MASQSTSRAPRVCLDFGTAFSKASAFVPGDGPARQSARALEIGAASGAEHRFLTPSVLFIDEGRIFLGPPALERARRGAALARDPILSFKTILSAPDLEQTLSLKLRPSMDATASLRHRDAFVLYLAHLDQLIRKAVTDDTSLAPDLATAPRRYTTPIWRTRGEGDRILARLFDEAAIVSERLGALLFSGEGVSISHAKVALEKGEQGLAIGQLERGVFEAHAAAAAYAAFAKSPQRFILVVDMGGGTTDLAAFETDLATQTMSEIVGARQCCGIAGDEVDQILLNLLSAKLPQRDVGGRAHAWRSLRLAARGLKEELFANGKCSVTIGSKTLQARREALLASADFRDLSRTLTDIIAASVRAVVNAAGPGQPITLLLAGGGANLAFMRELAKAAAAKAAAGRAVSIERFGADWYSPPGFNPDMEEAFPQIAIALGGALAQISDVREATLAGA